MNTRKSGLAGRLLVSAGLVAALAFGSFTTLGVGKATAAATPLRLPWLAGTSYSVTQTWNSGYHTGINAYAYDFAMPKGTAVLASAPGKVTLAAKSNTSGQCGGVLNEVHITHADGSRTVYMHLNDVTVGLNQQVVQAQLIGHVGCTGFAIGSHLHFQRNVGTGWGQPTVFYFDEYPGQQLRVGQWVTSQNKPPTPTPTPVVDDTSGGFTRYGPSGYWLQYGIGYGSHMFATWNNGPCSYGSSVCPQGQDVNYAIWRPSIPVTKTYRVCAYIPPDHAYTTNARYKIAHAGGVTTVSINQQPLIGWVSLGTYSFNAGTSGYVRLGDWTAEAFASRQIGFDAMKWVPNGGGCN